MNNQHFEFRIGIMVLAALAMLVFLTIRFGKQSIMNFGDEYTLKVRFQTTPGINKNSPVFKNGVQIGRVSNVELVDQDREVEVSILLPQERKVYTNEVCRVKQTVIMGDASLEFVRIPNYTGKIEVYTKNSPPLIGGTPSDLLSGFSGLEGNITKAVDQVGAAAGDISTVASEMGGFIKRVNSILGTPEEMTQRQARFEASVAQMNQTMQAVHRLADGTSLFVNDPDFQRNVKRIAADLPDLGERSKQLIGEAQTTVKEVRAFMDRSKSTLEKVDKGFEQVGRITDGVVKITDQLQVDAPEFMASLKKSAAKLEAIFSDIATLIEAVNKADGSLKRLMRDPALYEKLMETLDNVAQITKEVDLLLRTDVKPITNNVKVLTDKAARDPGIFIRNAIKKQPPIKSSLPIWGDGLGSDNLHDLEMFRQDSVYCDISYSNGIPVNSTNSIDSTVPYEIRQDGSPTLAPEQISDPDGIPMVPPKQSRFSFGKKISSLFPSSLRLPVFAGRENTAISQEPVPLPIEESVPRPIDVPKTKPLPLELARRSIPQSVSEETVDVIPEEGRIVNVDPRYGYGKEPAYLPMSYSGE